ncbi:hypothetical protein Clacol_003318 [Clathrus columnatus]|uniref:Uncharacterized protein n=1 Tax=Clathrus columnatus TaxID=1419009 RepID=A0AAV5A967_9AGAM|nr:hypothetical protein Clacol_003318 [Clathrus columnatus]
MSIAEPGYGVPNAPALKLKFRFHEAPTSTSRNSDPSWVRVLLRLKVKLQTDEISAAFTPHIAFGTTNEEFKGAAILLEMRRFYKLRNLYQEFESLAISKDIVIASK